MAKEEPPLDPFVMGLPKFTLDVYLMHRMGMTAHNIADLMGVDADQVVKSIVTVWRIDNPDCAEEGDPIGEILREEFR